MRIAYADPPYIGTARRRYGREEVDHQALLEELHDGFPDGWALSASASSLWVLLPMIPLSWKCRIAAWCQPFGVLSAWGGPQRAWEPVIFCGGRLRRRGDPAPPDFLVANTQWAAPGHRGGNDRTARRNGFAGAKPDAFCYWLFELLNMRPSDHLVDLFPGTGRVTRAWEAWQAAGTELFTAGGPV